MIVKVNKSSIEGEAWAPSSKSYTHRAIVIGGLARHSMVKRPLISGDTEASVEAARAIGAEIKVREDSLVIKGVNGRPETPDNIIDVANSGTTLRFFTAVASLVEGAAVLTGDASIRNRPNTPLLNALNDLGAEAFSTRDNGMAPLVVRGKLRGGKTFIDASISSQFLSALLIACPFVDNETKIAVKGKFRSRPYVDITLEMLAEARAKIQVDETKGTFTIPPKQEYRVKEYLVPGDFSSASYLLAAGALGGGVKVKNLYPTLQGDVALLSILEKMGGDVAWDRKKGEVKVNQAKLRGVTVDVGKTPDLVPTLAVLGAAAEGTTIIENAEHVRYKETDRLHAMTVELSKMGVDIREEKDRLIIQGGSIHGAEVHGWDDHRIVMALTIAGLIAGDTKIDTCEAVSISYPGFFEDLKRMGAGIEIL